MFSEAPLRATQTFIFRDPSFPVKARSIIPKQAPPKKIGGAYRAPDTAFACFGAVTEKDWTPAGRAPC